MNKTELISKMSLNFNRFGLAVKKNSPEILVISGVIGTIGAAILACKATTKINDVLSEAKEDIEKTHAAIDRDEKVLSKKELKKLDEDNYTDEDGKKDLAIIYIQTGVKLIKMYAPAIVLGTLSIASILTSNNILKKRNVAIAAAYATVDKGFKEYRERVIDKFGEEIDKELRYKTKVKEIEETVVNEDGTETVVKNTVDVIDPNEYSIYARIYDDGCAGWTKDAESNLFFLKQQQNWATDRLRHRGYLFLNEVYESLGIPATQAGQVVGWLYDPKNPVGDNFVDFGIYDLENAKARDFVNGYERNIILDFNVDGVIYDLIG